MDHVNGHGRLRFECYEAGPGIRYVIVSGEADLATANQLRQELKRLLAPSWVTRLALDLAALRHLDCAALAALLAVRETASARGQRFVIVAAAAAPARVLALSAAGELFDYPPSPGCDQAGPDAIERFDEWV